MLDFTFAPTSWPDSALWRFEALKLIVSKQNCSGCGRSYIYNAVYRLFCRGASQRRLVPYREAIPQGTHVIFLETPPDTVPVCTSCYAANAFLVPFHPIDDVAWQEALRAVLSRENELSRKDRIAALRRKNIIVTPIEELEL